MSSAGLVQRGQKKSKIWGTSYYACIGYLKGRAVGIRRRLSALPITDVAVTSIVKAELFYGAMKSSNPQLISCPESFRPCCVISYCRN